MALPIHYTGIAPLVAGLLVAASVASAVAGRSRERLLRYGLAVAVAGWFVYVIPFVTLDYSLREAFWNTSPGLPLSMRIASAWAGGGGSLYLFAVIASAAGLYLLRIHRSRLFQAILGSLVLAALAGAFLNGAFALLPERPASGAGLNPLLKSPWLYPHPLSTFGGYALLAVAAAAMLTGEKRRSLVVYELGWALLTLGIMIGGYWSYETFGWGGYWAWDPVETSELMVWLVATTLPHFMVVVPSFVRYNAAWLLSSVFIAMYVTRTGLSPLHSFAAPGIGALLLLSAGVTPLVYGVYVLARNGEKIVSETARTLRERNLYKMGLFIAGMALLLSAIFVYGTLFLPSILSAVGVEASVPQMQSGVRYFHPVLYPLLVAMLAAIPLAFTGDKLGWKGYTALLLTTTIVSTVFALAAYKGVYILAPLSPPETNALMAFGVPWAVIAAASTLVYIAYRLWRSRSVLIVADRLTAVSLLHLGLAVTVLGVILSGTYAFNDKYTWYYELKPGDSISLPSGAKLTFEDFSYGISNSTVDIYTNYVGRSSTYVLAWNVLNFLKNDLAEFIKLYNQGKELFNSNKTVEWLFKVAKNSPIDLNTTVIATGNATVTLYDLENNGTMILARNQQVKIILDKALLRLDLNMDPNTGVISVDLLVGAANLTVELPAVIPIEQDKIGFHKYIEMRFTTPLRLRLGDVEVIAERIGLLPEALLLAGKGAPFIVNNSTITGSNAALYVYGYIKSPEAGKVKVPSQLSPAVAAYLIASLNPTTQKMFQSIEQSSLYQLLVNSTAIDRLVESPTCLKSQHGCFGYVDAPRLVPETAWLEVRLKIEHGDWSKTVNVRIRFEAYGEIQGIHGLVSKVIPIGLGLDDVYVVVSPPVVEGYIGGRVAYHELLVYYLHEAFKHLPPEKRLALAALMAAGYNVDVLNDGSLSVDERQQVEATLVDLYLLAENFGQTNSTIVKEGLHVQVKIIPGIRLVWIGPIIMALGAVYIAVVRIIAVKRHSR
ncbi:Cytochrome c biogenesis factor [Pyrodictium delaneyi]|uniref:Cytochrome c biogenesis factor n=1 Tax=Pyrodictium delaneyi TaxID=1273541 RepID=A0A0P0N2I6_9CREN|nr:cytochrome c biogenesis protein CcsA [Pyrodictium delaneyi]ALL00541.1 Cytochrome c biogenesis factor [Pyrodictium delaneyi]